MLDGGVWNRDIQYLKNVGPKRVLLLKKLGIGTVGEILYFFPRHYDDRSRIKPAGAYDSGEQATVKGVVVGGEEKRPRRGLTVTRIFIDDGAGGAVAVWYNQPFIRRQLPAGTPVLVTGKVRRFSGEVQIQVSDYELEDRNELINTGRVVPVYPLTEGLSQRVIRSIVKNALDQWGAGWRNLFPETFCPGTCFRK